MNKKLFFSGWEQKKWGQNCYDVSFNTFYFKISYKDRLLWYYILEYKMLGTSELG